MQITLFCLVMNFVVVAMEPNNPFLQLKKGRKKYDKCGEFIPSFSYNTKEFAFANNSMVEIISKYEDTYDDMPERCKNRLIADYEKFEEYRTKRRCDLLKLPRLCPAVAPTRIRSREKRVSDVAFVFVMYSYSEVALASAERIVSAKGLKWRSRFVFHVDASSPDILWANVSSWVDMHPVQSLIVSKADSVDVEWGDISTISAHFVSMRAALEKWPDISTIVLLAESHVIVASPSQLGDFFNRYPTSSFPGMPPGQVPGEDRVWKFWLNDVVMPCGRKMYHIGWRSDPISAEDGYYHAVDAYSFWSREFVDWVLYSEDGQRGVQSLFERLSFMTTSDELFWGTLFYNSPFCHDVTLLDEDPNGLIELSAVTWNRECDNPDNTGKELCKSMELQPMSWWYGTSAEYITPGDVPLLLKRRPIFARKLRPDVNFEQTMSILYEEEEDIPVDVSGTDTDLIHDRTFYVSVDMRTSKKRKSRCAKIVAMNGQAEWVPCPQRVHTDANGRRVSVEEDDDKPTPFKLDGCIGRLSFPQDEEQLEIGNGGTVISGEASLDGITSTNLAGPNTTGVPAVRSAALPSGYMYGHCAIKSVGEVRTSTGHTFCLSQILLRLMSKDPWSYQDISHHAVANSTIGFLPCDPVGTVGSAQQMFVFQLDGSLTVGARHTKDIRNKKNSKTTLCLVLVGADIKLKRCSSSKPSQRVSLIAAN